MLYKAMLTIDPSMGLAGPRSSEEGSISSGKPGGYGNSEIGSMRVLQEKKDDYRKSSSELQLMKLGRLWSVRRGVISLDPLAKQNWTHETMIFLEKSFGNTAH
jgi:hypothetical protein